jgi:hypothetical protein
MGFRQFPPGNKKGLEIAPKRSKIRGIVGGVPAVLKKFSGQSFIEEYRAWIFWARLFCVEER